MNKEKKCNLSCSECAIRNCYRREKQYPAFCLTEEYRDAADRTRKLYESDGIDGRLARAAAEIEGEYYGRLTRLEETIRFALKLGVKKLGIASCIGLLDEASIYARIVRTAGIETKTVICKVGAIDKTEIGLPDELKVCPGCNESCCNPALQAKVLNDWGAEAWSFPPADSRSAEAGLSSSPPFFRRRQEAKQFRPRLKNQIVSDEIFCP